MIRRRWRTLLLVLVLGMLAACGTTTQAGTTTTDDSPTATVQQALDRLTAHDEPGLQALFDPAMSDFMRAGNATEAFNVWDTLKNEQKNAQDAKGAIQTMAMQPLEPRSVDTVVPVVITYARGVVRWTFAVKTTAQGWRLTEIKRIYADHQ